MATERDFTALSEFMQYLARDHADGERLPALSVLSQRLGVSTATLREQLEVARALGLVEVRPKTGIRRLPYQFRPAVCKSLAYATTVDPASYFAAFSDLRNHIEAAYFLQASQLLTPEDHAALLDLVARALDKLEGHPIQIPHTEHRQLHLMIYCRLENPFVTGILEAYWEAYEAVGLNMYTDISYLTTVWRYHQKIVEAVCAGDFTGGHRALLEHTDLLQRRVKPQVRPDFRQEFE